MTQYCAPQEFLCEIADVSGLIDDLLGSPRNTHWHWPSYYQMYVEADRLLGLVGQAAYLFDSPFAALTDAPTTVEQVEGANSLFSLLGERQRTLVRWLWQMSRHTSAGSQGARRERLRAHVHPKSGWYQTLMQDYSCGVVSADGQTLARIILPTSPDLSGERLSFLDASCMMCHQSFDLGAPGTRLALAQAAREAGQGLGKTVAAMTAVLAENCKIEDLLHPCSF